MAETTNERKLTVSSHPRSHSTEIRPTEGLPNITAGLNPLPKPAAAVRIAADATWVQVSLGNRTAAMPAEPARNYILTGHVATNGKGNLTITPNYGRFDGADTTSASVHALSLPAELVGFRGGAAGVRVLYCYFPFFFPRVFFNHFIWQPLQACILIK